MSDERLNYLMAVDWLTKTSGWPRQDVVDDGESAGWFCAQRAKTDEAREEAHALRKLVARNKP